MLDRKVIKDRWHSMKKRCYKEYHKSYKYYGGRGIKICDEWLILENFYKWYEDNYVEGLTLDRVDNNGNYEPSNCKFSTKKEQQQNRNYCLNKPKKRIRFKIPKSDGYISKQILYEGKYYARKELERKLGLPINTITSRMSRGWTELEAYTIPKYGKRK